MKIFLQLIPAILSIILTAAHFLRAGNYTLMILSLSVLILLFLKYRLFLNFIRVFLIITTAMWLNTMITFIKIYNSMNISPNRMIYILGGVILFNILSFTIIFFSKSIEERFSKKLKEKS